MIQVSPSNNETVGYHIIVMFCAPTLTTMHTIVVSQLLNCISLALDTYVVPMCVRSDILVFLKLKVETGCS